MSYKHIVSDIGFNDYDKAKEYFSELARWACVNCKSFISIELVDVSDVSLISDIIAVYKFEDEKDLLMFTLKSSTPNTEI